MGVYEERNLQRGRIFELFRVTWSTFDYLCIELGPLLLRQDTTWRHAIPVDKRIATGLYFLAAQSVKYSQLSIMFAVGASTANQVVLEALGCWACGADPSACGCPTVAEAGCSAASPGTSASSLIGIEPALCSKELMLATRPPAKDGWACGPPGNMARGGAKDAPAWLECDVTRWRRVDE